jgi:hypothetical protein
MKSKILMQSHLENSVEVERPKHKRKQQEIMANSEAVPKSNKSHYGKTNPAFKHGGRYKPEYGIWSGIKVRCLNKNNSRYSYYGGREITVCKRWLVFENFFEDMGERPSKRHSVERKNNNLGYTPKNCIWATRHQQAWNRRNSKILTFQGKSMPLGELAQVFNISAKRVWWRLSVGWSVERSLTQPIRPIKKHEYSAD